MSSEQRCTSSNTRQPRGKSINAFMRSHGRVRKYALIKKLTKRIDIDEAQ